jgi:t-SNARE complex subunit (syntaxin)
MRDENEELQRELAQATTQSVDDVSALHQQLTDIVTQNQRLAHMLHDQSETIDQLHTDAEETETNVDKGTQELQQAVQRDSHSFRNLVVSLLVGASACLLFLDWMS